MLDNFDGAGLQAAAKSIKERWQGKREVLLECSGGLTEENVREYVNNGELQWLGGCLKLLMDIQILISSRRAPCTKAYLMWTFR